MRVDHPDHLRLVFEWCNRYQIQLNPQKCIFCVKVGRLLGFIMSKEGIRVDPLKVEEIIWLSPLRMIRHIQSLQGMVSFLQIFIINFTNLTKGFMHHLKKDSPFIWDEWPQKYFNALKKVFASVPMLIPPDYSHDFLLYMAASQEMIGMVMVQEDEELQEHVIYYLS